MRALLLGTLLAAALTSCGTSNSGDGYDVGDSAQAADAMTATPVALEVGEHAVQCGCAIESIGHCGEYAQVDGRFVALVLPTDHALGKMPFCGKAGLTAQVGGELTGDTLVASSFELQTGE